MRKSKKLKKAKKELNALIKEYEKTASRQVVLSDDLDWINEKIKEKKMQILLMDCSV